MGGIYDFFTTSENERKRNYYKKVIKKINNEIEDINTAISTANSEFNGMSGCYTIDDNLYGEVMDKFYGNNQKLYDKCSYEIEIVTGLRNNLNTALEEARYYYKIYEQECIKEDQEDK